MTKFGFGRTSFLAWVFELGKAALILAILGLFIHSFMATIFVVEGSSMEPNFKDSEYLLINRLSYFFQKPKRGDAVILKFPGREKEKYIKRIIGLPNEIIQIKNNQLFINDQIIKEDYLAPYTKTEPDFYKALSEKEYFVLGDNRENSNDSRIWGTAPSVNLIGKAVFVLYPFSEWNFVPGPSY